MNLGAGLAQRRRLVTELPGPRSRQLLARRDAAVSAGINVAVPVFIAAAGGGVLLDVDGNSLIDLGSGIAVTSVGNAAPAVVAAVRAQVEQFTHTCFMVTPYESYLAVCEELARVTPESMRNAQHCSTPGPRPWRTRSRWLGTPPGGQRWSSSITPTMAGPISQWR